jgi:integrase
MAAAKRKLKLTDRIVRELTPPATGNVITWDTEVKRFGARVTARGARAFCLEYPFAGRERLITIGSFPEWTVAQARLEAKKLWRDIDRGIDPLEEREAARRPAEPTQTVADVLDLFMKRYAPKELRRPGHYADAFDRLVKPKIGNIPVTGLKRRHVVEMLDAIEDHNGAVMATRTLSYLRSALNWYATRDDEFTVPIVRGMARSSSSDRARDRTLDDDELRILWPVFGQTGNFGLACRVMLQTACRRTEVTGMMRAEISPDGATWTIPAARYKTAKDHIVPLAPATQAIIAGQPGGPRVFPGARGAALSRGGSLKAAIDKAAPGLAPWRVHDLRRTARSLLSRAGIRPDIAERVLGHTIPGIGGVYDRHGYLPQKRDALERLAALIDGIVNSPSPNVVALREARR